MRPEVTRYSNYVIGKDKTNDADGPCVKWWADRIANGEWFYKDWGTRLATDLIVLAQEVLNEV